MTKDQFFTLVNKKKALEKVLDGLGDLYGAIVFDANAEEMNELHNHRRMVSAKITAVDEELLKARQKAFTSDELRAMSAEYYSQRGGH